MKPYVESGQLAAIGVVQEQHPERARLYRQWRELDWPIFVDTLNVLDHVTVVPVPMAIDESGIVAKLNFRPSQLDEFMKTERERLDLPEAYNRVPAPDFEAIRRTAEESTAPEAWLRLGQAHFNWGGEEGLEDALTAFEKAVEIAPANGKAHFALGSALRRRYEAASQSFTDAQRAVEHWGAALSINPNHYIWRRRIQQYGPRLDKPYNFYFWVEEARKDIRARGEEPLRLAVEPMGSEIAEPVKRMGEVAELPPADPDPKGRIRRDEKNLVEIGTLTTPAGVRPGHRVRARVTLRLNRESRPLWNNEAGNLTVWVDLPDGLSLVEHDLAYPNPKPPETREIRRLEFEMAVGEDTAEGALNVPAYALYYVCEFEDGVCHYLRQDFTIPIHVDPEAPALR